MVDGLEFVVLLSNKSDDSEIEEMLFDDDVEHMIMAHLIEQFEMKRLCLIVGRLCIHRNRALGNSLLMKDYFTEVPT